MSDNTSNNKRIAKNTIVLYIRMLFLMFINLYTSRVVLNALGVEDYGIYNAVGGFVSMFAVVTSSLSAAISRFITFELGRNNKERTTNIFSTSVIIQFIIASIIIVLAMTVGLWFLNTKMVIPTERMVAANWVFILSIITFTVNLISIPYNACIIAHERMKAFAYIGIFDAIGKLVIALAIALSPIDNLIFYAILMCAISIITRFIYGWYCKRNFEECNFKFLFEKKLIKEIFGFASWNFIGSASGVLKDQGVNVLLNIFCGPIVNAARGIALQVSSAVTAFSQNISTAINPQITKSYASGRIDYATSLVCNGARFSFFMLILISTPLFVETQTILTIWLKIVPEHLIIFTRLILANAIIDSLSHGMVTLMLATGRIRNYQIIVGSFVLLNFPLSYIFLELEFEPEYVFAVSILISICCLFLRMIMLKRIIGFPIKKFIKSVIIPAIFVTILSLAIPIIVTYILPAATTTRFVFNTTFSLLTTVLVIMYIGCRKEERNMLLNRMFGIIKKR